MTRWKRRALALARLAEDQRGKPEGEAAARKLRYILEKYPEACEYEPIAEFTMRDLRFMRDSGISTGGKWEGESVEDAIAMMIRDYRARVAAAQSRKYLPCGQGVT